MKIPLVDLSLQHREVASEIAAGFAAVVERGDFILGAAVAAFETEFARFEKAPHCIGVGNGTDAIELILRALDLEAGAEVIVPANSFIATALAVSRAGATPVFVDCELASGLIDVEQVRRRVTPRTRAIVPVHLYGQIAAMEPLAEIAAAAGIPLVEDAAQAQGAERHGRAPASWGCAAAFSFYPAKNLGAYGDAGAVVTHSSEMAARIRALRNYGSDVKYNHPETGFNSRLDTLQAVVLNAKLARLADWNAARRAAASRYDTLLAGVASVERPPTLAGNEHVWHLYIVRIPERDTVWKRLNELGIGAGVHYPRPIHLEKAFAHLGHRAGEFPAAERRAAEMLSLPLYPGITAEQQEAVAAALRDALS